MKTFLFPITIAILLTSCAQSTQTEKDLRESLNKPLHIGKFATVRQGNTLLSFDAFRQQYEFLSVVYLQNGCQPCYPKFIDWQQKMDSIGCPENHSVLFVILGNSYEEFFTEVLNVHSVEDHYFTIMDSQYEFLSRNDNIPKWQYT